LTTSSSSLLQRIEARLPLERRPWQEHDADGGWPQAAVLVALTDEQEPRVLLGRRAMHLPLHPGEVAFAGGKREAGDDSPWDTALRETMEEVGLPRESIEPLGELDALVTRTGFQVFPCVASVPMDPALVVDAAEFDSVFFPRLSVFGDRQLFRLETITLAGRSRKVPHYQVGEDNVWGVTAAVLAQLANVAYDAGFDLQRDWKVEP